jgi:hypothetical protein
MFRKKFRPVYIVLNTWSCILLFKFVLWYTLYLFCVEFKIILYQFLYRCGHFNLSLIANQTISDSFLEKMLTKPPNQKSKTHIKNKLHKTLLNSTMNYVFHKRIPTIMSKLQDFKTRILSWIRVKLIDS